MHIAYAVRRVSPLTGVGRVLGSIIPLLTAQGHEVTILSHRGGMGRLPEGARLVSVPMLPWPSWVRAFSFDVWSRRKACRLAPDILHGQGDLTRQDVLTVNNCDRAAAYYVPDGRKPSSGTAFIRSRQFRPGAAKRILAVSRLVSEDLESFYGVSSPRVEVVYPGVDLHRFSSEKRDSVRLEWARQWGLPQETFYFISVLSGDPSKRNLNGLLTAFAGLHHSRPHQLLVMGPASLASQYPLAGSLERAGKLRFLPVGSGVEHYLAGADLYLLCAHYEEFGLPVLEAMASGCPALTSSRSGAAEIVHPNEDGWHLENPASTDEIRFWMERALETSMSDCNRMRARARQTAQSYSWGRMVENLLRIYREAAI